MNLRINERSQSADQNIAELISGLADKYLEQLAAGEETTGNGFLTRSPQSARKQNRRFHPRQQIPKKISKFPLERRRGLTSLTPRQRVPTQTPMIPKNGNMFNCQPIIFDRSQDWRFRDSPKTLTKSEQSTVDAIQAAALMSIGHIFLEDTSNE